MTNHHEEHQKFQDTVETKLDQMVQRNRQFRASRQQKFGELDEFRVTRDSAIIVSKLSPEARSLMLSAAINRLAQMADFAPTSFDSSFDELEAMFTLEYETPEDPTTPEETPNV